MTIRRGEDWGGPGTLRDGAAVAATDEDLAQLFADARADAPMPEAGLVGGDLARTVGASGTMADLHTGERTRLPIDVGEATIDGTPVLFVAHLVVRRRLWRGASTFVMNAAFIGHWNVAPRSHPNDGRLDVITAALSLSDRFEARRRLPSGTHIPHPDIGVERRTEGEFEPERGAHVYVDGVDKGRVDHIGYRIVPDAATIVI